jgi:hypothetical protein
MNSSITFVSAKLTPSNFIMNSTVCVPIIFQSGILLASLFFSLFFFRCFRTLPAYHEGYAFRFLFRAINESRFSLLVSYRSETVEIRTANKSGKSHVLKGHVL